MNNSYWKKNNYQLKITQDGSPSLQWIGEGHDESMHHSGGAWSETLYIYGEAIQQALQWGFNEFASVGLGLGFNEFLVAGLVMQKKLQNIKLTSFEKDPFLKNNFILHIENSDKLNLEAKDIYLNILNLVRNLTGEADIEEFLNSLFQKGEFQILGELENQNLDNRFDVILYDAFSAKTTPALWEEDFLTHWLKQYAHEKCIFSTYACTGALKRALKANNFRVFERLGFQGKRNSTFAYRGIMQFPDLIKGISGYTL